MSSDLDQSDVPSDMYAVAKHWGLGALFMLLAFWVWFHNIAVGIFDWKWYFENLREGTYYRDIGYFGFALYRWLFAGAGLALAGFACWTRPRSTGLLIVSLVTGLCFRWIAPLQLEVSLWNSMMDKPPKFIYETKIYRVGDLSLVYRDSVNTRARFDYFGLTMQHFPTSLKELDEHPEVKDSVSSVRPTPYFYKGNCLPFTVVFIPNAKGPFMDADHAGAPGTHYLAVRADKQRAWMTSTMLPSATFVVPRWTHLIVPVQSSRASGFVQEISGDKKVPLVWLLTAKFKDHANYWPDGSTLDPFAPDTPDFISSKNYK